MANALRTVVLGLGLLISVVVLGGCTSFFQGLGSVPDAQSADVLQLEGNKGKLKGKLTGCAQDLPGSLESLVTQVLSNPEAQQLKAKLEQKGKKAKRLEAKGCKVKNKKGKGSNSSSGFWSPLQATDPASTADATLVEVPFGENASLFALISPADEQLTWANVDEGERVVVMDAAEEQAFLNPQDNTSAQALEDLQQDSEFQSFTQELAAQGIVLDASNVQVLAEDVFGADEVEVIVALPEAVPAAPASTLGSGIAPEFNLALDPDIHYYKGKAKRVAPTTSTTARKVSLKVVPSSGRVQRAQEFNPAVQTWCPHSWTSRMSSFKGPLCDSYELKVSKQEVRETMLSRASVANSLDDTYDITYSRSRTTNTELLLSGFGELTETQIKDLLNTAQPVQAQAAAAWESAERVKPLLRSVFERYRPENGPDDGVTEPGEGTVENAAESLRAQILSILALANGDNEVTSDQQFVVDKFKAEFIRAFDATFNPLLRVTCAAIRELFRDIPLLGQLSPDDVECAHESMGWMRPLVEHVLDNQFSNPVKITEILEAMTKWLQDLASGQETSIKGAIGEIWVAYNAIQLGHDWVIQDVTFRLQKPEGGGAVEIDLILYKPEKRTVAYVEVKNQSEKSLSPQADVVNKLEKIYDNLEGIRNNLQQSQIHAEVEFVTFVLTQNGDFSHVAPKIRERFGDNPKIPVTVAWKDNNNQVHVDCIGCNDKFTQADAEQAACEMGLCKSANSTASPPTGSGIVVTGAGLGTTSSTTNFCRGGMCLI